MALLTLKEIKNPVIISLLSHAVPALVSYHGIGKTDFVKQIASELGFHMVTLECGLLKEGEAGGLPYIKDEGKDVNLVEYVQKAIVKSRKVDTVEDKDKIFAVLDKKLKEVQVSNEQTLVYAAHHVLKQIMDWTNEDPNKGIILFLDEFNRSENAVMQECMNLILNREINGLVLPDNVYLILAMNPSNKFSDFKNSTYMTNDMDLAQLDRIRPFFIKGDAEVWLEWATQIVDEETGATKIEPEICEFIASNPEALNQPESTDDIAPSSRSWERLSHSYKIWKTFKGATQADLKTIARGDLGPTVALQFTQFLENCEHPLIKPQEVFEMKYKNVPQKLLNQFAAEPFPRMLMTIKNCIRYCLKNNKKYAANLPLLIEMITAMPRDMMVMTMSTILNDHYSLHQKLVKYPEYLDAFSNLDLLIN